MEEPLRLVILADDPLTRTGLASLLAEHIDFQVTLVTHTAGLPEPAQNQQDMFADIIVWDMGWEIDIAEDEEKPTLTLPTIALIQEVEQARAARSWGCRGILFRRADPDQLAAAVRAVSAGLSVYAPELNLIDVIRPLPDQSTPDSDLTPREMEVLTLLAEGWTNKAIGKQLDISDHTVKFHVYAIMSKLNAQSRTDAVVRATRLGLLSL